MVRAYSQSCPLIKYVRRSDLPFDPGRKPRLSRLRCQHSSLWQLACPLFPLADFPPFSMGCHDVSFGEQRACNRQVQGCRRFHGKPATDSGFPSLYSRPCNPARFPKVSLRSFTLNFSKIQGLPLTRSAILIAFLSSSSRNRKPSPTLHSGSDAFHSRGFLSWLDDLQVDRPRSYESSLLLHGTTVERNACSG